MTIVMMFPRTTVRARKNVGPAFICTLSTPGHQRLSRSSHCHDFRPSALSLRSRSYTCPYVQRPREAEHFVPNPYIKFAQVRSAGLPAPLLEHLPIKPVSLSADTAYNAGQMRQILEDRGVTAFTPHPSQAGIEHGARGGFEYRGDHLVFPQGKALNRAAYHRRTASYQYVARQKDCQACQVMEDPSIYPVIGVT